MMVSAHAVSQVYHTCNFNERCYALHYAFQAVLCQWPEAFFQRGIFQITYAGTVCNQVVYVGVHLEDFHNGLAAVIALMAAHVASSGAVKRDIRGGADIQQSALTAVWRVGR